MEKDPDAAEERAIQEYLLEEESSQLSWIVNNGLSVGKKVLVTCFVMSSAPLVLPPLVVVSVLGFACSLPSGLFFASYALADKLMSKLLPGTSPPHLLWDYRMLCGYEEVEDNEVGEGQYIGLEGHNDVGKAEEEEALEDTWGEVEMRIKSVDERDTDEVGRGKAVVGDENADTVEIEVKTESATEEEGKSVLEETGVGIPVDEVHAVVVGLVGDEVSDLSGEEIEAPAFAVTNVGVQLSLNREIEEDAELVRETRGLIEKIKEEGMTEKADEKENKNDYGNVRIEKEILISTNADAREIADESGLDLYEIKHEALQLNFPETVEDEHEGKDDARISSQKDLGMAFNEVLGDKKKIWQQIDALREIVGYKAAKRETCIEELKALFLFTGVEPPATFRGFSDLPEINDKLDFLKSIVGVK